MSSYNTSLLPQDIVKDLAVSAKESAEKLITTPEDNINNALSHTAASIRKNARKILDENTIDICNGQKKDLTDAQLDRLRLCGNRIEGIASALEDIAKLPSPVGNVIDSWERPNGLSIKKITTPIGVIGMIYEARPNVTTDSAALCLKSKNAVVLRCGSECLQTSLILHEIMQDALEIYDVPPGAVGIIPTCDRGMVAAMLQTDNYIDLILPRGGTNLIERVMRESRIPVLAHLDGICHVFIHCDADPAMAHKIVMNSKMRRTGTCNAMETLLIDENFDTEHTISLLKELLDQGCEIVGDKKIQELDYRIGPAKDSDWITEYLERKLSVKFVRNYIDAVRHINTYGSKHTDAIVTNNEKVADYFLNTVDSGSVMHNASTQFADGGEYGMGAEIGIATGKLHARGPVGVNQLVTYKYIVRGNGHVRSAS